MAKIRNESDKICLDIAVLEKVYELKTFKYNVLELYTFNNLFYIRHIWFYAVRETK